MLQSNQTIFYHVLAWMIEHRSRLSDQGLNSSPQLLQNTKSQVRIVKHVLIIKFLENSNFFHIFDPKLIIDIRKNCESCATPSFHFSGFLRALAVSI